MKATKVSREEERELSRRKALARHEFLHKLFVEDRLGFEREKKRILDNFFDSISDEERKDQLRKLQHSWDVKMRHAGSAHNRLVLAQTIFWTHFHEVWQPALQRFNHALSGNDE